MKWSEIFWLHIAVIVIIGSLVVTVKYGYRNATANDLNAVIERLERIESKVDKLNHSR